jgi:competence protein ComEC
MNSPDSGQSLLDFVRPVSLSPVFSFDTLVIGFGFGIGLYFSLLFEPLLWGMGFACLILSLALWWGKDRDSRYGSHIWVWGMLVLALLCGMMRATWHTEAVSAPRLPAYERSYDVNGWVERIEASGKGVRWHVRVRDIDGLDADAMPRTVRIRLGQKHKEAALGGDYVSVRAIMSAPPEPVVPGGYNPAQRAFFERVGGFGFAISVPEVTAMTEEAGYERRLAALRYGLAARIYKASPEETAGLQVALLTGVRRYIPPEHTEALRAAGLAHILAISGLHMGLLAGSAFYVFTFLLALIAPLSRRYDVRKPAAGLAIIAATIYLLLSGASVATQRAYIMAVILFLAVILDRRAISIRSVSVAAFLTLMLHPESLISVGFQMSFAAVLALVVVYRIWQDKRIYTGGYGFIGKVKSNAVSLSVTSLVAGLATGGFALFHFGRIARYGLAGNLLAMPIFTFAVMPLGIISLLALPFGLEEWPLWLMGQSIAQLLHISQWIAGWDGAMMQVRAAPYWVIGVYSLAFILVLLFKWQGRIIGVLLMGLCFIGWSLNPVPDIRISADGRVAFWEDIEFERLVVTSERADRYGREQFAEKAGQGEVELIVMSETNAPCDELACRFLIKGKTVSILNHPSEARQECAASDVVILTLRDGRVLWKGGAQEIYISDKGIRRVEARKPPEVRRPWD